MEEFAVLPGRRLSVEHEGEAYDAEAAGRNVECREEPELTRWTYLDVLSEIQERHIAANQTALQERSEEMVAVLERAVKLAGE